MTAVLVFKASILWLGLACLAIGNGLVREAVLAPALGAHVALPLSGLTLSILIFLVTCLSLGYFGQQRQLTFLLIGLQWALMTLAFEFLFGHYVAQKPWSVLAQNFDVRSGDLFSLVLLVSTFSPWAAAKLKGVAL